MQILNFDRRIMAWHRSNEASRRLDEIPGVGPALATARVATVADPKAFYLDGIFRLGLGSCRSNARAGARTSSAASAIGHRMKPLPALVRRYCHRLRLASDMRVVFFGNTPDESQPGLIVAMFTSLLKLSNGAFRPLRDARSVTMMNWFRSRSRLGAYLALFALAFQLAVSFGHVHLDHIALPSMGASALAHAQPSADGLNAPSNPAGREGLADDHCPICTLIHLAGALVPAEMPSLPLPTVVGRLRLEVAAEFDLAASQGALFRARAPPIT